MRRTRKLPQATLPPARKLPRVAIAPKNIRQNTLTTDATFDSVAPGAKFALPGMFDLAEIQRDIKAELPGIKVSVTTTANNDPMDPRKMYRAVATFPEGETDIGIHDYGNGRLITALRIASKACHIPINLKHTPSIGTAIGQAFKNIPPTEPALF